MTEKAMRTANGTPVMVDENGEYITHFPREDIVRRADTEDTEFVVYGFVGDHQDYEEQEFVFDEDEEDEALDFAWGIYASERDEFERDGEVFEVEVHERDKN